MKKRVLSLLLAAVLLVTALAPMLPVAKAAKAEKNRTIAIVFDNSGSMYYDERWCRATYAMEVFASMLNDGDTLYIFPMNPITVDGKEYDSLNPMVFNGPNNTEIIRRIMTKHSYSTGTPFQSVELAHAQLMRANTEDKYLIVLTDGTYFHINGSAVDTNTGEFSKRLAEYSDGVEQMFLAIDAGDSDLPTAMDRNHQYIDNTVSEELLPMLTSMCNRIFGRDVLEVSGKDVNFNVSMSKLIVFVQGKDITDVKLSGGTETRRQQMQYSTEGTDLKGSGQYEYPAPYDPELQGMLVTYEHLDAGTYQLTYSGNASNVAVYYEPDVDLQIQLKDMEGNDVDPNNVGPGRYRLIYTLVDKYGIPTNSELLSNLNFSITYPQNGTQKTHTDTGSGYLDFDMQWGDTLDGPFTVTYLRDYSITKRAKDLGWPDGGIVIKDGEVGATTLEITGGADTYLLSQLEQDAVYHVRVFCDGQPITGSDLDRVELSTQIQNGNALVEQEQTADGFTLRLKYNGSKNNTQCGDQSIAFTAVYSNRDGVPGDPAYGAKSFYLEDDSQMLKVDLELEQDYYVISDLENAAPVIAKLTVGGAPLTREQFEKATVTVTIEGLQYDVQPDPGASRYVITLKGGENIKTGDYTVHCHVDGVNGVGKPAQAEDSAEIELQKYPLWLRILFWILVVLLILFIIWRYMNAKVLPKDIRIAPGGTFNVDGEMIPGQISCTYTGKNRKRGTLRVNSPQCMSNPLARCGFTLELEAISPRRTRSAARSVMVRGINPMNSATTQNLQVGTRTLAKDPITERLVGVGIMPGAPIDVRIGNNANTMIMAEVMDMNDGNAISCTLTARLKFF